MTGEYENIRRVVYGEDRATFVPVCECGRFVRADETILIRGDGAITEPNATCAKHGRILMLFEGYI